MNLIKKQLILNIIMLKYVQHKWIETLIFISLFINCDYNIKTIYKTLLL
jgi:hypothetical protein